MLHEVQYFYILIAFSLSLLVHYLVIEVTHRKGIFLDEHDKIQKVHEKPTPRIGGLGIFLSSMFILNDNLLGGYLILAAIPAFVAGFLEDYSGKISPTQRLAIMCLSPVMAFIMIPASLLTNWGFVIVPAVIGMIASVVFIVAMVNGVNFTDGQNGLASGTVLISFVSFSVISFLLKDTSLFYICLVMCAAVFSFLIYNFPDGKIFLGDGGAYLLGFMLAAIGIITIQSHNQIVSPLLLPAILIYPLCEVVFSTFRKIFYDKISPLKSDDFHLHQLLFRNRANGKAYAPALIILPLQAIAAIFVVLFLNDGFALVLVMLAFLLLYSLVYIRERRSDTLKMGQAITVK
ncbi:undecaprenyl/decaprenyl-phosphate alpha-N-acetylglucosaminyl 1-phosphate transferase [Taibaiella lutea]|uniref:Undecaprenyl/decaprenyl-phosphate alpha-N-acetylglucosaminyl 1-phosphate transferase n=1 Tax=Taibaiella lutea TaxID=2608001 RepID=A0A5M6CFL9_9BACT|nr:MraY family glycosyltransferase [Taibaiella lutea]KAA5533753.1 undecaprenyl/decaprenyl-phosphate alpha-N-acetylglucosaminyl 1-phosphate transferase [Taibaiella lutea]